MREKMRWDGTRNEKNMIMSVEGLMAEQDKEMSYLKEECWYGMLGLMERGRRERERITSDNRQEPAYTHQIQHNGKMCVKNVFVT